MASSNPFHEEGGGNPFIDDDVLGVGELVVEGKKEQKRFFLQAKRFIVSVCK